MMNELNPTVRQLIQICTEEGLIILDRNKVTVLRGDNYGI